MKLKISSLCSIGIFLILLMPFTRSLQKTLYGGNSGVTIILFVACLLIFYSLQVRHLILKSTLGSFQSLVWLLVLVVALINNADLKRGNQLDVMQLIVGIFVVMLLQADDQWCNKLVSYVKGFAAFMLLTGIFLLIFKGVLQTYMVPLFNLDTIDYYSETLSRQISNGYMTGLTSHYSTMGIYMSLGFIFYAGDLFKNNDNIRLRQLVGVGVMLIGIYLTGKRSALIFPLIAVLLIYAMYFKPRSIRKRYNYMLTGLLVVLAVMGILSFMPSVSVNGTLSRFMDIIGNTNLQELTNTRYEMLWIPAILLFQGSPMFGIGWGNFKYSFTMYYASSRQNNAHNVYLQLLCETGIVGTILVLGAMLYSLFSTMKMLAKWRKNLIVLSDSQVSMLGISAALQVYFLLYSLSGNPLYDMTCFFPYMLSVAMSFAIQRRSRKNQFSEESAKNETQLQDVLHLE